MNFLLNAASSLYGKAVTLRNHRFDKGLTRINRAEVPVISVGNISAGGTGKTPFTQALVRLLQEKLPQERPAIVSRGYGRTTRGGLVISNGSQILVPDANRAGDEALLHALTLAGTPVIVHEKRFEGSRMAVRDCGATCVVLDDGFQHRHLHRDLDIVLIDAATLENTNLLPAGRLREPLHSLSRADVVCFMNGAKSHATFHAVYSLLRADTLLLTAEVRATRLTNTITNEAVSPNTRVCGVSGIANPTRFHASLQEKSMEIASALVFGDHVRYSLRHVQQIVQTARSHRISVIATTEKDLVKLRAFSDIFASVGLTLAVLPIRCTIEQGKNAFCERVSVLLSSR